MKWQNSTGTDGRLNFLVHRMARAYTIGVEGLVGLDHPGAGMKWREMARMRRRALRVFKFNCPNRGSEAAVGDETIIMIRLSGIG